MRNRFIALISTIVLASFAEAEEASKLLKAATDNVTLSGLIEVSANQATDFEDHDVSDITLSTAEVALDAEMNEFTKGHILFLHEEDADESVVLDEGTITLGGTESNPWFFTAGKMYLPFGVFSSNMVSDPLTLELGEINQSTAQIGYRSGGLYGSVYGFNCDVQEDVAGGDDNIECFGANVGWGSEDEESPAGFEIGYLSNIADTDGLEGVITDAKAEIADYAGGYSISGNYSWDSFSFMGEYIAAAEDIDYVGGETLKQPKAWMVEFAYNWKIGERDTVAAFGYQATDNLAGVLPESRILGTFGIGVTDGVTAALEYAHDNDYDTNEGGTGETGHAVTAELALSF